MRVWQYFAAKEKQRTGFNLGDTVRYHIINLKGEKTYGGGVIVSVFSGDFVDVQTDSGYLVGIAIQDLEKIAE